MAAERTGPMLIETAPLWLAATNTYVVAAERSGPAVIVDVPPDVDAVAKLLARLDCYPVAALVTHGHIDHVGGAGRLHETAAVASYLHPDDGFLALDPASQVRSIFGINPPPSMVADYAPPPSFTRLADGQRIDLAGFEFEVLHTPGHTPGHCCFHVPAEGVLFSGDQLFAGSVGRTDFPYGSHEQLMESMRRKILPLDPGTQVLPGHGPATTIARERATNPFLLDA